MEQAGQIVGIEQAGVRAERERVQECLSVDVLVLEQLDQIAHARRHETNYFGD